jgi:hypothetical protein
MPRQRVLYCEQTGQLLFTYVKSLFLARVLIRSLKTANRHVLSLVVTIVG